MTAFQYPRDPTAVVGRRILAYGIDLLIGILVVIAVAVPSWQSKVTEASRFEVRCSNSALDEPVGVEGPRRTVYSDLCIEVDDTVYFLDEGDASSFQSQLYLVSFGIQALNLILLQGLTGASVGKLLTGLRVVRSDGQTANIGWAALRWVVLLIDSLCCFLPGAVLVFSTKGHRRLGDMAASTFVVSRKDVGQPIHVPGVTAPEWQPGPANAAGAGGWAPPVAPSAPAPAAADGPQWDEARNTYIQYDRAAGQWVQWDDTANQWKPIDS